jgi:hypothetical protein
VNFRLMVGELDWELYPALADVPAYLSGIKLNNVSQLMPSREWWVQVREYHRVSTWEW